MGKYLNLSYGAIQGTYWMYFGVIMSFSSVFLLAKNYTNSEIGVILALASILAVFIQPVLADIADKSKKISLMGMTAIITASLLLGTMALYLFTSKSLLLSTLFVLLVAWLTSLQPLLNSMAFQLSSEKVTINFGITRAGGSIAFAALTAILGALVLRYGISVIPATGGMVLILLLVFLWVTKALHKKSIASHHHEAHLTKNQEAAAISLKDFIRRNKMFIVFTGCIVLIFFQNAILNNYLMQILSALGGDSGQMGRLFSFMALLELPGLIFFTRIRRRFSCQFLLKVASIAFTIKIFLVFSATSVAFIYIAYLFQLISFPIFLSGSVYLVDEVMEKGEAVKGQSAVTSMMTVSSVFASLVGGAILDYSGPSLLLLISTLLCLLGTIIILFTIDKIKSR